MSRWISLVVLGLVCSSACVSQRPPWFDPTVRLLRASAHERFLVVAGEGQEDRRERACATAELDARGRMTLFLIDRFETNSEVVAVCGGPARVGACLTTFAHSALVNAPRTAEAYDDARRHCWVELRWLEPRHLASAIRRVIESETSSQDVALALNQALGGEVADPSPAPARPAAVGAPTAEALLAAGYRGWFVRLLPQQECATHQIAFVGAPGGGEARWLELKRTGVGWVVVDDERIPSEGWPTPPTISLCD